MTARANLISFMLFMEPIWKATAICLHSTSKIKKYCLNLCSSWGMASLEWRLVVSGLTSPSVLTSPGRLTSPGMVIGWMEMLASTMCIASKTAFTWVRGLNAAFLPLLTMGKWMCIAIMKAGCICCWSSTACCFLGRGFLDVTSMKLVSISLILVCM